LVFSIFSFTKPTLYETDLPASFYDAPAHCSLHFAQAQTKTDEAAVRECLENYMSGDGTRIEKAFHPTAFMKYIDAFTGEFKDVPIRLQNT
jgi:hypothetical protein